VNLLCECCRTTVVTDVAVDHDSKNQESTGGDFGAPHWVRPSWALSYWGAVHIGAVPCLTSADRVYSRNRYVIVGPRCTLLKEFVGIEVSHVVCISVA
jgi:hypothetical protein